MPTQPIGDATSSVTDWLGLFLAFFSTVAAVTAAAATVLTLIVTVFAVLYARRQWHEARASREQTAADQQRAAEGEVERLQPQVSVFMDIPEPNREHMDLVIKNFGPTAAYAISVTLDPEPQRSAVDDEHFRTVVIPDLPFLAPGQEWRTFWDDGEHRMHSDFPKRHEGVVHYRGLRGAVLTHEVVLDWTQLDGKVYNTKAGTLRTITEAINGAAAEIMKLGQQKK